MGNADGGRTAANAVRRIASRRGWLVRQTVALAARPMPVGRMIRMRVRVDEDALSAAATQRILAIVVIGDRNDVRAAAIATAVVVAARARAGDGGAPAGGVGRSGIILGV